MSERNTIVVDDVSKFYGEVLGVNRVTLALPSGITSLVGPNGSGKTTLMNLMTGLIRPSEGSIEVFGVPSSRPEELFRFTGYCTQFDSFPRGTTGSQFVSSYLQLRTELPASVEALTKEAIERVGLTDAAHRRIAGYSKGMRQRIKLAQAIAHRPRVLILDEPLNGLDPLARAEIIRLFKKLAQEELHLIISSHILHEVDLISDRVVMMNEGYVVAEGSIRDVRREMTRHPLQVLIRCDKPGVLASRVFEEDSVIEVKLHPESDALLVSTRDADSFYLMLNRVVIDSSIKVSHVAPADENARSIYEYLIGSELRT